MSLQMVRPSEDLSGKIILVTGGMSLMRMFISAVVTSSYIGTAGLGRETILALSQNNPEHIFFAGRDETRASSLIQEVKNTESATQLTFLPCDFTSLASVEAAARTFLSQSAQLDILVCNAGIMAVPAGLTKDGYEIQFGVNHLAHGLLIKLLLPALIRAANETDADARIVSLSSNGYTLSPSGGILFETLRSTQDTGFSFPLGNAWMRYGQSKLANLLYIAELSQRYPSITALSIDPGATSTGLVASQTLLDKVLIYLFNRGMQTPADGARNQVWACTVDKSKVVNGGHYEPIGRLATLSGEADNNELARRLWDWTEKALERHGE